MCRSICTHSVCNLIRRSFGKLAWPGAVLFAGERDREMERGRERERERERDRERERERDVSL